MTAQDLKNSILQLAVQGKLVPQNPADEPASELLKRIHAEKVTACHAGIIKKDKKLPEIEEAELPYDTPDTWEWLRLGQLCQLLDGVKMSGVKYPYLEAKYLRGKIEGTNIDSGKFVKKGTMLILVDGENSGEVFFASEDGYMGSTFKVLYIPEAVYVPYVLYFLLLKKQLFRNRKTGAAIPHLNKELFFNLLFPVPPLAEQERIVAKVEELLPLVSEYDGVEKRISALNTEFPDKLRKSILQQAMQGKLTDRDPSDEPAVELLKRINAEKVTHAGARKTRKGLVQSPIAEDEKPFDLPDTWEWVRFTDVIDVASNLVQPNDYLDYMHIAPDNIEKGTGKLFLCRTVAEDKVSSPNHLFGKNQLIYSKIRPLLRKVAIAPFDGLCSADMYPLKTILHTNYVKYVILSDVFNNQVAKIASTRVKMPKINQTELGQIIIPLPPLDEQRRIADRIEELLAACKVL